MNNKGFSLIEGIVSLGLLSLVGVGVVALNSQHKKADSGIQSAGDMTKVLSTIKTLVGDPKACQLNFAGKTINSTQLQSVVDANNQVVLRKGDKLAKNTYEFDGVSIKEHDALKSNTRIEFLFNNISDNTRSKSMKKTFIVFSVASGGTIDRCLDPVELTAEGALYKACIDADPKGDEGDVDCENNYANLLEEIKVLYCEGHPYLDYDPGTKKCLPLDANKVCPAGQIARGYNATGSQLNCMNPPVNVFPPRDNLAVPAAGPAPSIPTPGPTACATWASWSPSESSVCSGIPLTQTRACLDGGTPSSESRSAVGIGSGPGCSPPPSTPCGSWGGWTPTEADTCTGTNVAQTRSCLDGGSPSSESRSVSGTKACTGCKWGRPFIWNEGPVFCGEYFLAPGNPMNYIDIEEGGYHYANATYGPSEQVYGHYMVTCTGGVPVVTEKECKKGLPP